MRRTTLLPVAMIGTLLLTATACTADRADETRPRPLLVLAAASLTNVFADIEAAFETAHPEYEIVISYASSSQLREQILEGAPADVFASADQANMAQLMAAGEIAGAPAPFAVNQMQIAVPAGNPAGVAGIEDFADPDLLIGLCAEQIPCGMFGREVLAAAGVKASVDTNEASVLFLLTKIETGELDAGLVYRTDVAYSDLVGGIDISPEWNVEAVYPIATLTSATNPQGAVAFIAFVLSAEGRAILETHGFGLP